MTKDEKKKRNQQIALVVGVVVVYKLRKDVKVLTKTVHALIDHAADVTEYQEAISKNLVQTAAVAEKALELAAKAKK